MDSNHDQFSTNANYPSCHPQILLDEQSKRPKTIYCEYEGCSNYTNEGKPYCREHCHKLPYAAQVIAQRKWLAKKVKKTNSRVDLNDLFAKEIMGVVKNHSTSVSVSQVHRVLKQLWDDDVSEELIYRYMNAMTREGQLERYKHVAAKRDTIKYYVKAEILNQ